jgi:hypothetical protein
MSVLRLSTYNYPWPDEVTIATGRLGRCCWRCWCLPCYRLWTRCASSSAADDSAAGSGGSGGGGESAGPEGDIESCGGDGSYGGGDDAAPAGAGASSDSLVPLPEEMERGGGLSEIGGPRVGEEPSAAAVAATAVAVREAGLTPQEEEQWRNVHHFIRNRAGSGAMIPSDAVDSCAVTSNDCDSTGAGTSANSNEATGSATMNLHARFAQRQQLKRAGSM